MGRAVQTEAATCIKVLMVLKQRGETASDVEPWGVSRGEAGLWGIGMR